MLELSAAFDGIDHFNLVILETRFEQSSRITGNRIIIGSVFVYEFLLQCGVPKGSARGPKVYFIFVQDQMRNVLTL